MTDSLLEARARVVHDLIARGLDSAAAVDVVEEVVSERRWWVEQWPDGAVFVAGQVAQDVQDRLLDRHGRRWPLCRSCDSLDEHALRVVPELGAEAHWVCESAGLLVADLGRLGG